MSARRDRGQVPQHNSVLGVDGKPGGQSHSLEHRAPGRDRIQRRMVRLVRRGQDHWHIVEL